MTPLEWGLIGIAAFGLLWVSCTIAGHASGHAKGVDSFWGLLGPVGWLVAAMRGVQTRLETPAEEDAAKEKRGYFDCGPVNVVLPLDEAVTLSLLPAGLISGQVKSVTGGIPPRGLVIFLNTRTSVVVQAKVARDGRFTSPPLEGGEWRVDWTSDVKTPTDPRISTVLAVVPRQELVIEITAGRPGAEPRGRRKVGLTLVEE